MFVLVATLGGCVRHEALWGRSVPAQRDYDRDRTLCDQDAIVAMQTSDSSTPSFSGETLDYAQRKRDMIDHCMTAKGWTAAKH